METLFWVIGAVLGVFAISFLAYSIEEKYFSHRYSTGGLEAFAEFIVQLLALPYLLFLTKVVSKIKDNRKTSDDKVIDLIDQLNEHRHDVISRENSKAAAKAAKKLGDLGNPLAMSALREATGDFSLEVVLAAEEAIRKIEQKTRG